MKINQESVNMLSEAYIFFNKVLVGNFGNISNMANGMARLQTVLENLEKENKASFTGRINTPPEEGDKSKKEE